MKTNRKIQTTSRRRPVTHEGGPAVHQSVKTELERAVATCMLFESTFYEKGSEIAARIASLCARVPFTFLSELALKARTEYKLRHVPLWLCVQMIRRHHARGLENPALIRETIYNVIQRPDEMGELLSLYWADGKIPLSSSLKQGLAKAFTKFSEFQLAKWNRDADIKLRDILFLVHAKPIDKKQERVWKRVVDNTLKTPDTWEVALSAGKDKKKSWEKLLKEEKLGYMALLMNLRNMSEVGVNSKLVTTALLGGATGSKALPFRFVAAYKHAPMYTEALSEAMEMSIEGSLKGSTVIVVDVSGSMTWDLSDKGKTQRWEAAAALAVLIRGITKGMCRVFVFDYDAKEVPNVKGLALVEAISKELGGGTQLRKSLQTVHKKFPDANRVVVITDEQSRDGGYKNWSKYGYLINIAPYSPGLSTSDGWTRINGFSERIAEWMQAEER